MQAVLYDGTFEGWLSAVFDVYDYRFRDADLCPRARFQGNVFGLVHQVHTNPAHSERVWKGLEKKLTYEALQQVYHAFLSEEPGMDNTLLQYVRYVFDSEKNIEKDYSHPAVLAVQQVAKKVHREKHRMEAFVRFQKTADGLYYAVIEPDHNVLPLIAAHFRKRYADQPWLIWDARRRYGLHYDLQSVSEVSLTFAEGTDEGRQVSSLFDSEETMFQELWQQYFKSVNIPARRNTKLQVRHMPARYWKYLPEKRA